MAITISLDEDLAAALENRAKNHHLTLEQFAIGVLADAVEESETATPEEVVAKIQALGPNPASIRIATGSLADALRRSHEDPQFDLQDWTRRWSAVEHEMKALSRANDMAEGRGE